MPTVLHNPKTTPIAAEEELLNAERSRPRPSGEDTSVGSGSVDAAKVTVDEMVKEELKQQDCDEHGAEDVDQMVWHPALDEVNSDMHHFVEQLPSSMDDVFAHGVLAKIDYDDEATNISEFVRLENEALSAEESGGPGSAAAQHQEALLAAFTSKAGRKKKKGPPFPVQRWEDPLVLKVVSARRVRLDSIAEYSPLLRSNIHHLQLSAR